MLLAIDVGNTNITVALFDKRRLAKRTKFCTYKVNLYRTNFKKFIGKNKIEKIIICSVVPKDLPCLNKVLFLLYKIRPLVCGKDLKVPIRNLYKNPKQVGQDRLVDAFAAVKIYGTPSIIIDFGTAVTFDIVSKREEYLGGIIFPGIDISFDSLFERTALLPLVEFKLPNSLIGKDTVNSIRSGIVYGYASLADGLVRKLKQKIGGRAKVIATGGYCEFIAKHSREIQKVDKNLTLKGLLLLSCQSE